MDATEVFSRIWAAFDDGRVLSACAWCGRVEIDGGWFAPPVAVLAAIDVRLAFSHSICNHCAEDYLPLPAPAPAAWSEPRLEGAS